ncbi:S41 family peptidase [Lacticigenium naphthae]|uniref:S41 family peptidase n=1 Tax=Lacticigenium naphthae TaxID=515351 RepID=UPI00041694E3|nr:S41 family peptidase [Lacticigenium naphthae]
MNRSPNEQSKGIRTSVYIVSLIIVAVLSVVLTIWFTTGRNTSPAGPTSQETGTEESRSLDFASIDEAYGILKENYFQEIDDAVLIEGAITGMAESLEDPYTEYIDTDEEAMLDESISGSFEGIGAEVMKEGEFVKIVSPIPDSPAEAAGLLPNDLILEVDGESVSGLSLNEAVALIRGEKGSEVSLLIQRGENEFEVTVVRDSIPVETILYSMDEENDEIGYIQITNFSMPTYDELVQAVESLRADGAKEFIFDVRGNPGGLLSTALELSNIFVEEGDILVQEQIGTKEPFEYTATEEVYGDFKVTEPAVLLIDGGSASASEILAGAMNESADIPLIGTTTFGKGTIQNIKELSSTGEIKMTIGKWLTPSGTWVHEKGIKPTIEVEKPEYVNFLLIDSTQTYQLNDMSDEIKNLEGILAALDYDPGTVDGYFDETTKEAIQAFQSENEIEATGIVTGNTATTLVDALRSLIEENDVQYDEAKKQLESN